MATLGKSSGSRTKTAPPHARRDAMTFPDRHERAAIPSRPRWRDVPAGVWTLGFVSLLMDLSSEMIHALLPVYLVAVLGTSMLSVGIIEGVAEASASIVKIFSGALSDWLGKAQGAGGDGLRARGVHETRFPASGLIGVVDRRKICGPRRERHTRSAARCARRRHYAHQPSWSELRIASVTGHRWRLPRAPRRDRPDVGHRGLRRVSVLDRSYSGLSLLRVDHHCS